MLPSRWFSPIVVFLVAVAAACGGAAAQVASGNTYSIGGVEVDVTAADAIQARNQGIREAERKAIKLLVERMVAAGDRPRVPPIDDNRLENLVRGVEFAKERTSINHYAATLNVVFGAAAVKAWLSEAGIHLVETVARPALVIPLWKDKNGVEPLDDHNAWRDAWQGLDTAASTVPVSVVRGDQLDQNELSVEEAYVGDVSALSRLNGRYRAPTVIVVIVEGDKNSGPLQVGGIYYDTQTGARSDLPKTTVADAGQLGDAAKKMQAKLDDDWRSVASVRRDEQAALDAQVPIRTLGDWVAVKQRLGSVPAVKNVVVRSLESDRAEVHIDYFGSPEDLQRTLGQVGLQLDKDADRWRLQLR